jgi:hypothetical protein
LGYGNTDVQEIHKITDIHSEKMEQSIYQESVIIEKESLQDTLV